MNQILKNRCTVTVKNKDVQLGTYRPTQELFYEIQKELEPYRTLYNNELKTKKKYMVILKQEEIKMGTYRISPQRFYKLINRIEQYKSLPEPSKNVKCIETGKIFKNAREASKWAAFVRECDYCNSDLIKQCCRGKQKTSYGYHWEFVKEK